MIIYKVKNTVNKKVYIGKTTQTLDERRKRHEKIAKYNPKTHFHRSIKKYGNLTFEWEIIDTTDNIERLNELERKYISDFDTFKNGYNMTLGGDGGDTISHKSNEQKKNQGAKKGNIPWNKGKSMKSLGYTYEHIRPRTFTEEQKQKHSQLIKESKKFKEGIKKRKPAKVVVIQDDTGRIWGRQKDFIEYMKKEYDISHHKVRSGLSGDRWEYKNRIFTVIKRK